MDGEDWDDEASSRGQDPGGADGHARSDSNEPTPGERVLYALAQIHLLHRARTLPAPASALDIEDIARIVGVAADFEFATGDSHGRYFHFAGEVLCLPPTGQFPCELLSVWEWAADQEIRSFWGAF